MFICRWLRSLYWTYYWYRYPNRRKLVRSEVYSTAVKKLLLEDLNSMKFEKMI